MNGLLTVIEIKGLNHLPSSFSGGFFTLVGRQASHMFYRNQMQLTGENQ
jgi:hypothetical protein